MNAYKKKAAYQQIKSPNLNMETQINHQINNLGQNDIKYGRNSYDAKNISINISANKKKVVFVAILLLLSMSPILFFIKQNEPKQISEQERQKQAQRQKIIKNDIIQQIFLQKSDSALQDLEREYKKLKLQHQKLDSVKSLSQIYDIQKKGKIYHSEIPLRKNVKQTLFAQFNNIPAQGNVTVVLVASGPCLGLNLTISSFFSHNTYPIQKFVVLIDGTISDEIQRWTKAYKNITWIFTNENIGELAAIDTAYKFISTDYFLHLRENWVFIKPGYVEYALNVFSLEPKAVHIETRNNYHNFGSNKEKWRSLTYKQSWNAGYSLNPSLHRLRDYTKWPGGFSNLTNFASFGRKAKSFQVIISIKYIMDDQNVIIPSRTFTIYLVNKQINKESAYYFKDFSDSQSTIKLVSDLAEYEKWVEKENKDTANPMFRKPLLIGEISNINQVYSFAKIGKIIEPTTKLQTKSEQILFPQFDNRSVSGDVTVVMTTSGRAKLLITVLNSFFDFNTYPIKKMIVVHDGPLYSELEQLTKTHTNITWVITGKQIGQVAAIDEAYRYIQTEYYFHTEDDWQFIQKGFIEYCLHILQKQPKASGVWLRKIIQYNQTDKQKKYIVSTYKQTSFYSGFGFSPSLHRLKDYLQWPGGYSNVTGFSSFGMGAGSAQVIISMKYIMKGFFSVQGKRQFIKHIGYDVAQTRYWKDQFRGTYGSQSLTKIWIEYDSWVEKQKKI